MEYVTEIRYIVKTKSDTLIIEKLVYEVKRKEKFVRRKEIKRITSKQVLGEYKITVPFTIIEIVKQKVIDCTYFHNDYEVVQCTYRNKEYQQPDLDNFITEKIKLHTPLNKTTV